MHSLSSLIERFFSDHLRAQRDLSIHTISAYGDTFRLFLRFLSEYRHKSIDQLGFEDLDADSILAFLNHLEATRHNTARTRNARLAALRSFARFSVGQSAPHWLSAARRIMAIPCKRTAKPVIGFMDRREVAAVLDSVDLSTRSGQRDHLLFSLLYQTGARISEILHLQAAAVQGRFVSLHGKGRKERTVPLQSEMTRRLRRFVQSNRLQPDQPLFANRHGATLTREGVALRLNLAVRKAEQACPSLHGRKITPHVWRHTTAMHLLHAGVPLEIIALWLGHEQPSTTHTYVQADLNIKDQCAHLLDRTVVSRPPRRPTPFSRLLSFLEAQPRHNYANFAFRQSSPVPL